MRLRIPPKVIVVLDWFTNLLPPPTPLRWKVFGYQITKLDLTVVVLMTLLVTGYAVYYGGTWQLFALGALLAVLSWMMVEWFF